ncbi:MAG: flagellar protein FliT [Fimbriimonadales bacterium]|nr:flagellar protein FliT [Fimbriimonadales bacterium]
MAKSLIETLLHDFWMLSLCLEDAIEEERWDEVTGLLQRREETLRTLEKLEPNPNWLPLLRRALEADERCQSLLRRKQRALLMELEQEMRQRQCADAYDAPPDIEWKFEAEG